MNKKYRSAKKTNHPKSSKKSSDIFGCQSAIDKIDMLKQQVELSIYYIDLDYLTSDRPVDGKRSSANSQFGSWFDGLSKATQNLLAQQNINDIDEKFFLANLEKLVTNTMQNQTVMKAIDLQALASQEELRDLQQQVEGGLTSKNATQLKTNPYIQRARDFTLKLYATKILIQAIQNNPRYKPESDKISQEYEKKIKVISQGLDEYFAQVMPSCLSPSKK